MAHPPFHPSPGSGAGSSWVFTLSNHRKAAGNPETASWHVKQSFLGMPFPRSTERIKPDKAPLGIKGTDSGQFLQLLTPPGGGQGVRAAENPTAPSPELTSGPTKPGGDSPIGPAPGPSQRGT